MKYLLKMNVVSILYGLMIFFPIKLMLNVYRISRLSKGNFWSFNHFFDNKKRSIVPPIISTISVTPVKMFTVPISQFVSLLIL